MPANVAPEVTLDAADVRRKFDAIKEFSPRLARELRRELRASGDSIIAAQRAVLSGPLPAGIRIARQEIRPTLNKKTGKIRLRKRNVYEDAKIRNPRRSRGMRVQIGDSLKTRVVVARSRTGVRVQTTKAKETGATFWQAKQFRHPNWGRADWSDQRGQPYFWKPAFDGAEDMITKISRAVDRAFEQLPTD